MIVNVAGGTQSGFFTVEEDVRKSIACVISLTCS